MFKKGSLLFIAVIMLAIHGCAPTVYSPKAPLDTPSRHVENGIRMLNVGKIDDAFREFNRARQLNPEYSPAYVGIGFCHGLMGDYEKGLKAMKEARRLTKP